MKHIHTFESFINEASAEKITVRLSTQAAKSMASELKSNGVKYTLIRPTVFELDDTPKARMAIKLAKERFGARDVLVESTDEELNEASVSWTEKSGVTEFKIHGTTYSLYNVDKKTTWELYKFDEDNGPLVMKFKIEKGQMVFLYGGFDLDNVSRAYQKEIIDAVCSYFKIDPNKIVY